MEGWLAKRPQALGAKWERRFCRLRSGQFHYYDNGDVVLALRSTSYALRFTDPGAPEDAKLFASAYPHGFVFAAENEAGFAVQFFDAGSAVAVDAWLQAVDCEVSALSQKNSTKAAELALSEKVKLAAERAQHQLSEIALTQLVKQSRDAGAAIAEATWLKDELSRAKAANAQSAAALVEARAEVARMREQAKREEVKQRQVQEHLAAEIERLRLSLVEAKMKNGDMYSECSTDLPPQQRSTAEVQTIESELQPIAALSGAAKRRSLNGDAVDDSTGHEGSAGHTRRCSTRRSVLHRSSISSTGSDKGAMCARGSISTGSSIRSRKLVQIHETAAEDIPVSDDGAKKSASARHKMLKDGTCDLDAEDSDESELEEPPKEVRVKRRVAYSAEAYGASNQWRAKNFGVHTYHEYEERKALIGALENCRLLFANMLENYPGSIEQVVESMPIVDVAAGDYIIKSGDDGDSAFVLLSGQADVYKDDHASGGPGELIRSMAKNVVFGDLAMMWRIPRSRSVYAAEPCRLAKLDREVYQALVVRREMEEREKREVLLQNIPMFQTLSDEQIAQLADALQRRIYDEGDEIVRQGESGYEMFVVMHGECEARITEGVGERQDVQVHRRYFSGDIFGERAILKRTKRGASIVAKSAVEVFCLHRKQFERLLGRLDQLQEQNYLADPRKSIADFYSPGGVHGPSGVQACTDDKKEQAITEWFAVYRPTSREAISKMLNGVAVGKGLNVKGKSAKKNRLSGFVPFLQISNNADKSAIEPPEPDSRLKVFYTTSAARESALSSLKGLLHDKSIQILGRREIDSIDTFPNIYGIEVPEPVIYHAYIMAPDISFLVGWETGRVSEPAFMDMNLHAVRGVSDPQVVLYQIDHDHPMNPHGLLIAYAEENVKPVVSDFDTFTVGSRGMNYQSLAPEQNDLAMWALSQTEEILRMPSASGWNSRWLGVLKGANESGFHPVVPKYGFGDTVSYGLIEAVIKATTSTGAVRHGAECFNFYFPQELDEDYLVVWDGFIADTGKPWDYLCEHELRLFLLERIDEGYAFPLNPVWPVRDSGWYEVFESLTSNEQTRTVLEQWFPPSSNILDKIEELHMNFPDGFQKLAAETGGARMSQVLADVDGCEQMDLITEVAKPNKWKTVKRRLVGGLASLRRPKPQT